MDHGPPGPIGGQRVAVADGVGERSRDQGGRGGVGIGVAQAGVTAGVDLGDDDGDGIPFKGAVGFGLFSRDAIGGGTHVGNARGRQGHRRAAPSTPPMAAAAATLAPAMARRWMDIHSCGLRALA